MVKQLNLEELKESRQNFVESYKNKIDKLTAQRDKQLAKIDEQIESIENEKKSVIIEKLQAEYGADDLDDLLALLNSAEQNKSGEPKS
jgi:hypothetical protein